MPPKKQIQLQVEIETQEIWSSFIGQDGLGVIDVYSAWCGPCKAVLSLFRRIKNELGDDLLRFAIAKSDTIDSLEPYRQHSEPTFLFFTGGGLVSVVRGALGPLLEKTIKEQLNYEHRVLEGKAERTTVEDEGLNAEEPVLEEDIPPEPEPEPEIVPTKKEVTVMLIKPDAVKAGKVDGIIEQLKEKGLDVIAAEERQLSKEEAAEFYKQHEGADYFEELVEFMSSGPCMTVVVTRGETGEGVVEEVRQLMGPADVDLAKDNSPESLRAQFGTSARENAVHGSDGHETAARELAFFFPRLKIPWVPGTEPPIQRTLALIRPDCLAKHRDEMLEKVQEAGFEIAMQKELTLTKEQAAEFYREHEGKDYFESLCNTMSSGPMLALCLAREDAVSGWRDMLGPTELQEAKEQQPNCLRSMFSEEEDPHNPLHGSATLDEGEKEIKYFFPPEKTLAVIKPNAIESRDAIMEKIREAGFKISLSKETTLTREMAEQLYSEHKGKEFFEDLTGLMSNGPSLFMVLSREDAVSGWRALMGPPDPEEAKKENPDSIRALFGESVVANAVHGPNTAERAQEAIENFIGEVPEDDEEEGDGGERVEGGGGDGDTEVVGDDGQEGGGEEK